MTKRRKSAFELELLEILQALLDIYTDERSGISLIPYLSEVKDSEIRDLWARAQIVVKKAIYPRR